MRKGGGKQKGAAFEREICRRLSLWITKGKKDDVFWRSAMSGGRATLGIRKRNRRLSQSGDVSAISSVGEALTKSFLVECKFYKRLNIEDFLLVSGKGKLHHFWVQARESARKHGKQALLVAKQNGKTPIVITPRKALPKLQSLGMKAQIKTLVSVEGETLSVFDFEEAFGVKDAERS